MSHHPVPMVLLLVVFSFAVLELASLLVLSDVKVRAKLYSNYHF